MTGHDELRAVIRESLFSGMDLAREISDEEMYERIDREISRGARERDIDLEERLRLRNEIFSSIRRLDGGRSGGHGDHGEWHGQHFYRACRKDNEV